MRTAFIILLFANLAFLAWAGWIDAPERAPPAPAQSAPPRLMLATEAGGRSSSSSATLARAEGGAASPASASNCVSVGPFSDPALAARAMEILHERNFEPRQREAEGEIPDGYWVYVGGLRSAAEQARVLRTLEQARLDDAQAMPETEAGRRVSVGLFSERPRAERRARALRRLGFEPEITERRKPGTVYWVDLDVGVNGDTVPTEGLLSLEQPGSRLEVRVCPAVQSTSASG